VAAVRRPSLASPVRPTVVATTSAGTNEAGTAELVAPFATVLVAGIEVGKEIIVTGGMGRALSRDLGGQMWGDSESLNATLLLVTCLYSQLLLDRNSMCSLM